MTPWKKATPDFIKMVVDEANRLRKKAGSPPVEWDDRLEQCAIGHRDDLVKRHTMDHYGADGSTPWERIKRAGFPMDDHDPMGSGSEGLGEGFGPKEPPLDVFASETNYVYVPNAFSHATDLLNPHYNKIGAAGPDKGYQIWVVNYGYDPSPAPNPSPPLPNPTPTLPDEDFDLW